MLRVEELIRVINHDFSTKVRRKRIPAGFCYLCSQLDPRGRGSRSNPYRHLLARGVLKPCPHLPPAPHPTFVDDDDEDEYDDEDDGFDEESLDLDAGNQDGAMFDTKIVREDEDDPRLFSLPPVFGQSDEQHEKRRKRKSKNGRLLPMVSENTFLTTNKRGQGHDPDLQTTSSGDGLHLPRLSNKRTTLVAEGERQGQGEGHRRRNEKDPRRLHSERIDRRVAMEDLGRATCSDSALGMGLTRSDTGLSREKTDPPPQPILISIKNQDGEVVQKIPLDKLPPGTLPTEAFANENSRQRKKREKKQRRDRERNGSASPTFSGSMSISRDTTLSGVESPDLHFLSRLRSASWCECPDHAKSESRCGECRKASGHEKWCVSRNTVCPRCGKAFKRKYSHLERKSSFGTIPASGIIITSTSGGSSRNRHQNCSPTKASSDSHSAQRKGSEAGDASANRVRFHHGDGVVYPEREAFLDDSGVEDGGREEGNDVASGNAKRGEDISQGKAGQRAPQRGTTCDADVHRRAYDMALSEAKIKQMFGKKKKKAKNAPTPQKGIYFSYFPRLKRRQPEANSESGSPVPPIGVRADSREGKRLKVKKGLKHVLGDVKLADYYPGGKHYYPR
ncbi:uncharacterized protein [Littorina saxatilis]